MVDRDLAARRKSAHRAVTTSLFGLGHRFQQTWFQGFVRFHKSRASVWAPAQIQVRGMSNAKVGRGRARAAGEGVEPDHRTGNGARAEQTALGAERHSAPPRRDFLFLLFFLFLFLPSVVS